MREKREECQESRGKLTLTICVFFCLCSCSSSSKVIFTTQGFQSEEYMCDMLQEHRSPSVMSYWCLISNECVIFVSQFFFLTVVLELLRPISHIVLFTLGLVLSQLPVSLKGPDDHNKKHMLNHAVRKLFSVFTLLLKPSPALCQVE